jgi:hypothetical protein
MFSLILTTSYPLSLVIMFNDVKFKNLIKIEHL